GRTGRAGNSLGVHELRSLPRGVPRSASRRRLRGSVVAASRRALAPEGGAPRAARPPARRGARRGRPRRLRQGTKLREGVPGRAPLDGVHSSPLLGGDEALLRRARVTRASETENRTP